MLYDCNSWRALTSFPARAERLARLLGLLGGRRAEAGRSQSLEGATHAIIRQAMVRSTACAAARTRVRAPTAAAPRLSATVICSSGESRLNFTRTPITWARAYDIVTTRTFHRFSPPGGGRSERMQSLYDEWRESTLQRYATTGDFVNIERLGFPPDPSRGSGSLIQAAPLPDPVPQRIIWWINDFPYFLEDGVEHHVVWLSGFGDAASVEQHPAILAEIRANRPPDQCVLLSILRRNALFRRAFAGRRPAHSCYAFGVVIRIALMRGLFRRWEVIHWENPIELRSIPAVRHLQVLSRQVSRQVSRPRNTAVGRKGIDATPQGRARM